jgi:transcriptional regulator with XRE-family HTH domain
MAGVPEDRLTTELEHAEREQERLGGFLRWCRARIAPESASLGAFLRLPMHIGKTVTQEEVAEAAGISRQWYARLEGDRPMRVSATVLRRIADALMMDSAERAAVFRLALPELRSASLTDRSTAVINAFGALRHFTRRLWAASTEAEALTLVREHALMQLAPDVMVTRTRVGEGRWESATTGNADDADRAKVSQAVFRERWGAAIIDDLHCYPFMAEPGELMTRSEHEARFPDLVAKRRAVLDALAWRDISFAMANVRSQRGFVARILALHHAPHAFSKPERAQLSTLGELTSLALSGRAWSR